MSLEDVKDGLVVSLMYLGIFVVIAGALGGGCYMKSWRYDECLAVGHSASYCRAEYIGCIGGK